MMKDSETGTTFSTFLRLLLVEIASIDEVVEPIDAMEDEETLKGYLSQELRKLYTLWRDTEKRARLIRIESEYTQLEDQRLEEVCQLQAKALVLESLFWFAVQSEFDIWRNPGHLAVRSEWRVAVGNYPDRPYHPRYFNL